MRTGFGPPSHPRRDRADRRPAAHQPRDAGRFRRQRPAFLGKPSRRRHPIPVHGGRPHPAQIGQRRRSARRSRRRSARLRGSISARSLRRGSARNHSGAVSLAPVVASSSHSRRGGDGSCGVIATASASSGRWNVWCIASAPGRVVRDALCMAASARHGRTRLAARRRASTGAACRPPRAQARRRLATPLGARRLEPAHREERDRRHQRQRVADEARVLKQQVERQVRQCDEPMTATSVRRSRSSKRD